MLFIADKSIAYATSHTLEINGEATSTANKDEGGGDWDTQEISILSWTASSENMYSTDGAGDNFGDLFDLMVAKTPIKAVFARKNQDATEVPTGGWSAETGNYYEGKVVISSLSLNAAVGEYATYSVQFQGVGALQKKNK